MHNNSLQMQKSAVNYEQTKLKLNLTKTIINTAITTTKVYARAIDISCFIQRMGVVIYLG